MKIDLKSMTGKELEKLRTDIDKTLTSMEQKKEKRRWLQLRKLPKPMASRWHILPVVPLL
ncbi:hypothetical protein [Yoonia sp. R2-816]|uniref:hypothetical protein n=1 Tax=Yoonia sp. R2-816 TaxID=3342638 RepID=UPI00372AB852